MNPPSQAARAARAQIEEILDSLGQPWPWHAGASRLLDYWLTAEESEWSR